MEMYPENQWHYETRVYWTLQDILDIAEEWGNPTKVTLCLDGPFYDVQGIELEWGNRHVETKENK